jgi:hypothetical protein
MTRDEIDTDIERAQSADSVSVPRDQFYKIIAYARSDNTNPSLLARVYTATDVREGEPNVTMGAAMYIDLLKSAMRGMRRRRL